MNAIAPISAHAVYTGSQLALIRKTVAADCNEAEFDLFVTVARHTGLDPFRKQISALVFNKTDPKKRRMAIVTTIDGLRVTAARSQRYRPDEEEPEFFLNPEDKGPVNPLGLERARVKIYIADAAGATWRPVTGVAYWTEFAPIKDEWAEGEDGRRRPTGRQTLDTGGNWAKMPRLMLAKCAEAQALRKAFPEELSSIYERAELDQAMASEMTPSEMVGQAMTEDRLARVGAGNGILLQLFPNTALEPIALGQVADRVLETVEGYSSLRQLKWFEETNTHPMREFWARAPGDALELKKRIEAKKTALAQAEEQSA